MIVDDSSDMRKMLRSILTEGEEEMMDILECSDGREAVVQYSLFHPDIVLMDIQLKTMNGFVAAENIYKQEPKAKIFFITSYNSQIFRDKAKKLKAQGFILKDDLSDLQRLLHIKPSW